jgi:excisionase family DNA binding protein
LDAKTAPQGVTIASEFTAGFSIVEACEHYGISRTRLYQEIAQGRLRLTKIGRRSIIATADGDAWFNALRAASCKPA